MNIFIILRIIQERKKKRKRIIKELEKIKILLENYCIKFGEYNKKDDILEINPLNIVSANIYIIGNTDIKFYDLEKKIPKHIWIRNCICGNFSNDF